MESSSSERKVQVLLYKSFKSVIASNKELNMTLHLQLYNLDTIEIKILFLLETQTHKFKGIEKIYNLKR